MFYIYYPGNPYNYPMGVLLQTRKQVLGEEITQGLS